MYSDMVQGSERLKRGRVWCVECGRSHTVNPAICLQIGWPKCCGYTTTIDSPAERAATASEGSEEGA